MYKENFNEIHNHNTRQGMHINISKFRLTHNRIGVNYNEPLFYNVLPRNIQILDDKNFLETIKNHLLKHSFHTNPAFLDTKCNIYVKVILS